MTSGNSLSVMMIAIKFYLKSYNLNISVIYLFGSDTDKNAITSQNSHVVFLDILILRTEITYNNLDKRRDFGYNTIVNDFSRRGAYGIY